jgi:hypothetical protein
VGWGEGDRVNQIGKYETITEISFNVLYGMEDV